jgi:hypothetical protein
MKAITMKALALLGIGVYLTGCYVQRDVQAALVDVELVKVDTVERYYSNPQQLLTWRTSDNIDYVSFVPMGRKYAIGTRTSMLIRN